MKSLDLQDSKVADITAIAGFAYADFVDLDIPDIWPRLSDWRARV